MAPAVFYPGEVARLLDLGDIEYDTLRKLYELSRGCRGLPEPADGTWSLFDLEDLACTDALVRIAGGRDALNRDRRLAFGDVRAACLALMKAGATNPLIEVPMVRVGRRIYASIDDALFEPATGQLAYSALLGALDASGSNSLIADRGIRRQVAQLKRDRRPDRKARASILRLVQGL